MSRLKGSVSLAALIVASGMATSALSTTAQAQSSTQWEGLYLGFHVGYGDQDTDGIFKTSDSAVNFDQLDLTGVIGGGQFGYNWDSGSWVYGIEADFSFMDESDVVQAASSSESGTGEIDLLASIRGRLGVTVDTERTVLLYATGGIAYRKADATVYDDNRGNTDELNVQRIDFDNWGAVGGAGIEWAATDRLRLRLESLYYAVSDDATITLSEANAGDNVEFGDAWTVRIGVSYYF